MSIDRESPTPKISGSLARWPVFLKMAEQVGGAVEHAALRAEKVLAEIDFKRARLLRELQQEAADLVTTFEAWEFMDPGSDLRMRAIAYLYELRERADKLGVKVDEWKPHVSSLDDRAEKES